MKLLILKLALDLTIFGGNFLTHVTLLSALTFVFFLFARVCSSLVSINRLLKWALATEFEVEGEQAVAAAAMSHYLTGARCLSTQHSPPHFGLPLHTTTTPHTLHLVVILWNPSSIISCLNEFS